jgi:NIPSNAP
MHRRRFIGALGALSLANAAAPEKRTRFYAFEHFTLKNGSGVTRLHDFVSQALLPAMNRVHSGPKIVLEQLVGPHTPEVLAIYGFSSMEEMWDVHTKMSHDEAVGMGVQVLESGAEPAFESLDSSVVEAAGYSPEIKPEASGTPRIFELRIYHSPTSRQLGLLHDRFRGPEIKIFHRAGIHPILYGSTVIGPNIPNLTYVIPFTDLAAREKAWNSFGADPEWQKVRKESIEKGGEIVSSNQILLYKGTKYSPVR